MIRVLLSAPLCLHIRLSSRFTCWPEIWIVPRVFFLMCTMIRVAHESCPYSLDPQSLGKYHVRWTRSASKA
jgi:hypothetical protein